MPVTVRPLRNDEIRLYLQIHERAVRGLAATHYSREDIEGWVVPATEENLRRVTLNAGELYTKVTTGGCEGGPAA